MKDNCFIAMAIGPNDGIVSGQHSNRVETQAEAEAWAQSYLGKNTTATGVAIAKITHIAKRQASPIIVEEVKTNFAALVTEGNNSDIAAAA